MLKSLMMVWKNRLYANSKQRNFLASRARSKTAVWGRGTGKTSLLAIDHGQLLCYLPRAKGFLSSKTYNILETKTLPAIELLWQEMGYQEFDPDTGLGHYTIGIKPPRHWIRPYAPPRKFEHIVTWWNGLTTELLSMDRPDLGRGGSYDFGRIDEAALLPQEVLNRVLLPSLRGNIHKFHDHYLHHSLYKLTSMPWLTDGYYVLNDFDLSLAHPDEFYYSEATIYDNVEVLGERGIERMRRTMTYVEWMIECENQRLVKLPDAFYHKLDDRVHVFAPKYYYDQNERGRLETKGFREHKENELLAVSFDFSGWFNCASVWQERDNTEYCISSHHVKDEDKVNELVDLICQFYSRQKLKHVHVYGEPRGHDRNPTGDTIYEQVRRRFEMNGWTCDIMATARQTEGHEQRHYFMAEVLAEQNPLLPRIRISETCKDFILALKSTRVAKDYKKDKSKERDRKYPQEHAPHYTDGFDYYITQKHFGKIAAGSIGPGEWFL